MILLPAIDIIDQAPVRLYQGDYYQKEIVGQSVLEIAKEFEAMKAQYLHMVDLDGAKSGKLENARLICETAQALSIPVEVGGGIRSMDTVDFYLTSGVSRVILGTAALEDPAFLKDALKKYGEKIAVGIDCKDGKVCGSGWLVQSDVDYLDFAKTMEDYGVKTIIFTDIPKMEPWPAQSGNVKKVKGCSIDTDHRLRRHTGSIAYSGFKRFRSLWSDYW